MYILMKGLAGVLVGNKIVAQIHDHKVFGESALEHSAKRNASIIALSECNVLLLMKFHYDLIISDYLKLAKAKNVDFLR